MNNNEKLEKILLRYRISENHNDDFFNEEDEDEK